MFTEVLVVDIVTDLSYYSQDVLRTLVPHIKKDDRFHFCDQPFNQVEDEDRGENIYYVRAPRNTVLGIPYEEAKNSDYKYYNAEDVEDLIFEQEEGVEQLNVYYPFFSSHLCLPVKPGESIWTFESNGRKYWMTRVSQPLPAEDPNFTHRERRWTPTRQNPFKTTEGFSNVASVDLGEEVLDKTPSFPLGSSFTVFNSNRKEDITEDLEDEEIVAAVYPEGDMTFPILDATSGVDTRSFYDLIYHRANSGPEVSYEPVPRINKRPGDLVLQGSNNASIVLGTERAWTTTDRPDGSRSNVRFAEDGELLSHKKGVVDIVAGRGRIDQEYSSANIKDQDPTGTTRPRVIENTRLEFETHKNPGLDDTIVDTAADSPDSGHLKHPDEGDPDFLHDASRIYVSMKSNPDELLFGNTEGVTGTYPLTPEVGSSNEGKAVSPAVDSASIIVKSDEIRIIARQRDEDDPVDGSPEINGSIRIVKEGIPDDRDGAGSAAILMLPDGTVMIDGSKIVIGSGFHADDDGNAGGQQLCLGVGAEEPLVLGNKLGELLCKFIGAIVTAAPKISIGASPNVLDPNVLAAAQEVLTALGGEPGGSHTPASNTTLSKLGKTK